ncbi:hypothetical protein [Chryseobacterium shigense]|uniref:Uncharacterized protein n=1 Tax=Chryseobacterium shigense TaxID=297244 RepID=A0A841NDQ8_9FLAO|nr:hypothetical protein [Chryseobacterium shigense]MBB6369045.1 hypothetical protein [Chryseobacterium shigense]
MVKKQIIKTFHPGYFLIIRRSLGFCYLFFCFTSFPSQTFIHNKNFLHSHKGTVIHIEQDSQTEAVIFIADKTEISGLENISSSKYIIKQKNTKLSDKAAKKRSSDKSVRKLTGDKMNSSSQVSTVHKTSPVIRNIFQPKSSEYFTTGSHFNNSAVIPAGNLNIKIAVLSAPYFNRFRNFSLDPSFEKKYLSLLIYKVLINNHTVRPPPCNAI